jgi:hypothetical protein
VATGSNPKRNSAKVIVWPFQMQPRIDVAVGRGSHDGWTGDSDSDQVDANMAKQIPAKIPIPEMNVKEIAC